MRKQIGTWRFVVMILTMCVSASGCQESGSGTAGAPETEASSPSSNEKVPTPGIPSPPKSLAPPSK